MACQTLAFAIVSTLIALVLTSDDRADGPYSEYTPCKLCTDDCHRNGYLSGGFVEVLENDTNNCLCQGEATEMGKQKYAKLEMEEQERKRIKVTRMITDDPENGVLPWNNHTIIIFFDDDSGDDNYGFGSYMEENGTDIDKPKMAKPEVANSAADQILTNEPDSDRKLPIKFPVGGPVIVSHPHSKTERRPPSYTDGTANQLGKAADEMVNETQKLTLKHPKEDQSPAAKPTEATPSQLPRKVPTSESDTPSAKYSIPPAASSVESGTQPAEHVADTKESGSRETAPSNQPAGSDIQPPRSNYRTKESDTRPVDGHAEASNTNPSEPATEPSGHSFRKQDRLLFDLPLPSSDFLNDIGYERDDENENSYGKEPPQETSNFDSAEYFINPSGKFLNQQDRLLFDRLPPPNDFKNKIDFESNNYRNQARSSIRRSPFSRLLRNDWQLPSPDPYDYGFDHIINGRFRSRLAPFQQQSYPQFVQPELDVYDTSDQFVYGGIRTHDLRQPYLRFDRNRNDQEDFFDQIPIFKQ